MATVLVVDDEREITAVLGTFFERAGHDVLRAHSGQEAVDVIRRARPDLVLLDLRLPDFDGFAVLERVRDLRPVVIMVTGNADVDLAVRAMQAGAEGFLTKPVELAHLAAAAERALEKAHLRQMNRSLTDRRGRTTPIALLGGSAPMRDLAAQVELLARSERTTVLITGESGTGKARLARVIHDLSPRAARPFVEVNCTAHQGPSLDPELFGEESQAAGGEPRPGLLEVAHGGTIFLDEVGDVEAPAQPRLLRVLEGKSFRRVGGSREVAADVRLIASTSRDLVNEVTAGHFREDLYYRLSVMPIQLPPVRARAREDVVDLIARVLDDLRQAVPDAPATLEDEALDRMLRYSWPGNIRELRNVLERAMIMARGRDTIGPEHLPLEVREASGSGGEHHVPRTLAEVERVHIDRTLRFHGGNRTRAAKELGISRATLIKKIREYALEGR